MPQMNVGQGTTFTQIHAQFQTTDAGKVDKHVRFDNAKGLYTSQKGSTAKVADFFGGNRIQERQQKQAAGAAQIRQAIQTEHPHLADRIFAKLGQDHPGVNLAQGVRRGELDQIRATIDAVVADQAHLRSLTPQGLTMSVTQGDPGRLSGDLHATFDGAATNATKSYMDGSIADLNDATKHKVHVQSGFPKVVEQFMADVGRSEIRVGGDRAHGKLLKATGGTDPRLDLRGFAGSDNKALNLSKLVCQQLPTALVAAGARVALANEGGDRLNPRLAAGQVLPGNEKTQFISVAKQGDQFVIDYEVEHPLTGFGKGMDAISLDGGASSIKASMQITISADDLERGNLTAYRFTKQPEVSVHAEITTASLANQAGGGIE